MKEIEDSTRERSRVSALPGAAMGAAASARKDKLKKHTRDVGRAQVKVRRDSLSGQAGVAEAAAAMRELEQ